MRILRYLLAIALVAGLSGVANADDFQMVVIDPTVPANLVNPIFTTAFAFTFPSSGPQAGCKASQLDGLDPSVYLGCFTGENETGKALTSLQIEFPIFDFGGGVDQPSCSKVSQDIFKNVSCGFTNGGADYFLSFSGGNIPTATGVNGDCDNDGDGGEGLNEDDEECNAASIFTIAEAFVPPSDFPDNISAVANAPEPNSFWLMSTGVLSIGLFGAYRRRQLLLAPRP